MATAKRSSRARARRINPAAFIETPVRGVFISGKGELLTALPAGATVLPIATLRNAKFELSVGGKGLKSLKEADTLSGGDNVGISVKVAGGLEITAAALGVFSGAVKAVEATVTLLEWMGLIEEPNPFQELYIAVVTELKIALTKTLGGITSLTMQNIAAVLGDATTAAGYAHDALSGRALTPGILALADYKSRYAVTTLADEAYWKRTFDPDALRMPWPPLTVTPAPDPSNLVFDYRLTLLAYMRAIMARLAVIRVLDPAFRDTGSYDHEILGYVAKLRELEMRIRLGLAKCVVKPRESNWAHVATSCGVYDIHTGVHDSRWNWHWSTVFEDPLDLIAAGPAYSAWPPYEEYVRMFDRANDLRFWRLYDALGLFNLWIIISDLLALVDPARRNARLNARLAAGVGLVGMLPAGNTKKWKSQMEWIQKNKAALMANGLDAPRWTIG